MKFSKNLIQIHLNPNTILALTTATLTACAINFKKPESPLPPKTDSEISVMSFNVENLFDTTHDNDRNDYTFLPLLAKQKSPEFQKACRDNNESASRLNECLFTDWNDTHLNAKLKNLSQVVLGVDNQGPDVLMLIEVENENVLNIWNNQFLQKAQYKTIVLMEGPDKRGIDVGFMSRFPLVGKPILHPIPWKPANDEDKKWMEQSRRILEVTVKAPNGDPLTFFVAHFPSQANPSYWRRQISEFLSDKIKSKGPQAMIVAAGDLNITTEEEAHEHLFKDILGKAGAVSHLVGCKHCPGTHYYNKSWSFLDAQIYSNALSSEGDGSYQLVPETIDVIRYNDVHLKKGKYPKRWDNELLEGVSDHFPLYARLKQRGPAKNPLVEQTESQTKINKKPVKNRKK